MKNFILLAVLLSGLLTFSPAASAGKWGDTPVGLPYYMYDGVPSSDDDPAFLLGNYRLTLMTHASGIYELISGERAWSRFNADPERPDYGKNRATAVIDDSSVELVGTNSLASDPVRCSVETGIGFTRYDYRLDDGIRCSRMISVMPSEDVNQGTPAFLVSVTFTNKGSNAKKISYVEALSPSFMPLSSQNQFPDERAIKYHVLTEVAFRCLKADFIPEPRKFMRFSVPEARSRYDFAPLPLFLYAENAFLSINEGELKAMVNDFRLRPGASKTFHVIIGVSDDEVKDIAEKMLDNAQSGNYGAYESLWKKNLPDYSSERDANTRRELYWQAHMLESSASYDSYFDETFVPAGGKSTYESGKKFSTKDHLSAVLPLCYSDPELAKSSLRYVMKHVDFDGNLFAGNEGFGCLIPCPENDRVQAYLFRATAEYLRVTGDYDFLDERINMYPVRYGEYVRVIDVLERCFIYDNVTFKSDLAHSIRIVSSLPELLSQLKASSKASDDFIEALEICLGNAKKEVETAGDAVCGPLLSVELQTLLLSSSVITQSEKRDIYDYLIDEGLEDNLYEMELGTLFPLVSGISTFDALDARSILRKCSQFNMNEPYPGCWSGYSVHPYAWPLYCHYRLSE